MQKADYGRFCDVLTGVLEVFGKERSDVALAVWWKMLSPFALPAVERAFAEHVRSCRFAPTPADIIGLLEQRDGRPTADEAWAMIPRGESESVAWTDEMSAAYGIAAPLLEQGDQIAARRAFIDRYTAAVREARAVGRPAKVWFSWGWDANGRAAAVQNALSRGLLTAEQAAKCAATLPGRLSSPLLAGVAESMRPQ